MLLLLLLLFFLLINYNRRVSILDIFPVCLVSRNGSTGVVAIVRLLFQKDVRDPLQPLRDDIADGRLGLFTVASQLDINLSMSRYYILFSTLAASATAIRQLILVCEAQRRNSTTRLHEPPIIT